jgi:hypothetical protein
VGYYRVSESGTFDGQISYKLPSGVTLASETFAEVTDTIESVTIPLVSEDLITVTIQKTGSPATGTVDCSGLTFNLETFY